MKLIPDNSGRFYVMSDSGNTVMGVFSTKESAMEYMKNLSAQKSFSSNVSELGVEEAMKEFLNKTRRI